MKMMKRGEKDIISGAKINIIIFLNVEQSEREKNTVLRWDEFHSFLTKNTREKQKTGTCFGKATFLSVMNVTNAFSYIEDLYITYWKHEKTWERERVLSVLKYISVWNILLLQHLHGFFLTFNNFTVTFSQWNSMFVLFCILFFYFSMPFLLSFFLSLLF